jgi:hypothetical protein
MLFTELSAVYCNKYANHKIQYLKKRRFWLLKVMAFIVSTEIWRDNANKQTNKNKFKNKYLSIHPPTCTRLELGQFPTNGHCTGWRRVDWHISNGHR